MRIRHVPIAYFLCVATVGVFNNLALQNGSELCIFVLTALIMILAFAIDDYSDRLKILKGRVRK